ncbi:hypothetical protein [Streptomyces sp. NPDC057686]|uniref:hypothetical protein n=1 Tax=Streptomyces sp. NPDC057686 TaxID=3346212 RepID=UPI00369C7052
MRCFARPGRIRSWHSRWPVWTWTAPRRAGILGRADYLRLVALGGSPSLASQILCDGSG